MFICREKNNNNVLLFDNNIKNNKCIRSRNG